MLRWQHASWEGEMSPGNIQEKSGCLMSGGGNCPVGKIWGYGLREHLQDIRSPQPDYKFLVYQLLCVPPWLTHAHAHTCSQTAFDQLYYYLTKEIVTEIQHKIGKSGGSTVVPSASF